jgi:hypothetical protein
VREKREGEDGRRKMKKVREKKIKRGLLYQAVRKINVLDGAR